MNRAILDTDIYSEILKGRDPQIALAARNYRAGFTCFTITAITVMEIHQGLQRRGYSAEAHRLAKLIEAAEVLEFNRSEAELAGRISAELTRSGQPLGVFDPMIAAIALHHQLPLVTGNQGHFLRIQSLGYPLQLDNWRPRV